MITPSRSINVTNCFRCDVTRLFLFWKLDPRFPAGIAHFIEHPKKENCEIRRVILNCCQLPLLSITPFSSNHGLKALMRSVRERNSAKPKKSRPIIGVRVMANHSNETRDQDTSTDQSSSFWQTARGSGFGSHGHNDGDHHHPPAGNPDPGTPPPTRIEFRSIDGSGNNLANSQINSANSDFTRAGPAHFADGVSAPVDGPNPRMISNVVVGEGNADQANAEGLSGFMYAWGQFIDHDLDLSRSDGVNHIDITVPSGDPVFQNGSVIALTRATIDPATGTDAARPATAVNSITGWLDGSMVYGSDAATAAKLRLADGHMKTSDGNNLPIENGQFLAGDVRAQENPSLTALQTLFVREHNHQVDQLQTTHPDWNGDQLYNQARAIVSGEIANITYSEFLPHLLGPDAIAPYKGYDPTVDPRITEEFAGAAFRFGHSIVSAETERINENGRGDRTQPGAGRHLLSLAHRFRGQLRGRRLSAPSCLRSVAGNGRAHSR